MTNYDAKQFREIYSKLPEELKDAISSADTSERIIEIGTKHKLTVDKIGLVGNETARVMLGMTHPNHFIANLSDRLGIDKQKSRDIANDINEQIFKKVRDSLRKIHGITDKGEEEKAPQSLVPQAVDGILPSEPMEHREDILKEIEKDHAVESEHNDIPAILKGVTNPFEEKMKQEVYKSPVEEKKIEEKKMKTPVSPISTPEKPKNKYDKFDPYRESIE